jgi:AraC-like DNA-binding protein
VRLVSPGFGHLPAEISRQYGLTHRKTYYFFLFMIKGRTRQWVDLQPHDIRQNEMLFIVPHQIHRLPSARHGKDYFKLGFDAHFLSLLPKQYPFLVDPLNNPKVKFSPQAAARIRSVFGFLKDLLATPDGDPALILAHINSLMTEINAAYFSSGKTVAGGRLSKYMQFKQLAEEHLTEHLTVEEIARSLSLNTNSLYYLVKQYAGVSPRQYINRRLILEAMRHLYYSESASVKELAFQLGFNDPEYFARLFKREAGKSVSGFIQDLSGL